MLLSIKLANESDIRFAILSIWNLSSAAGPQEVRITAATNAILNVFFIRCILTGLKLIKFSENYG
jgi:hypothetical protein